MRSFSSRRHALVRIELLLDHSLRPRLLSHRLMLGLKLDFAEFTDSNHRNVLDSLDDAKLALGHISTVSHRFLASRACALARRL